MQLKKGSTRIVLLIPFLGIAVKLPIIRIGLIIKELKTFWVDKDLGCFVSFFYPFKVSDSGTFADLFFEGIFSNLIEFWTFFTLGSFALVPTYFTFFGLFNIQKMVISLNQKHEKYLARILFKVFGFYIYEDLYHFLETDNFTCSAEGRLQMIDYGSKEVARVLGRYGEELGRMRLYFD